MEVLSRHRSRRYSLLAAMVLPAAVFAAEPFWLGADLSYVNEMEACGAVYRENGVITDPFSLFARYGANLVRVRLFNDATWTEYSDLEDVKRTIRRSREAGMAVLLDFHYSDEWADGEKQIVPAAWADLDDEALAKATFLFTQQTLNSLASENLLPEQVQVGNETNKAVMRPTDEQHLPMDWERNALLLNAGIRAVREVARQHDAAIEVMLHVAQPENVLPWFEAAEAAGVTDFDLVGVSYYRRWSSEDLAGLRETLETMHRQYPERGLVVVETAYPWTLGGQDAASNILSENTLIDGFPASPQGQKDYLMTLTRLVRDAGGQGVVYWEPAWVSTHCSTRWGQGSHWENATFFDFNHGNEVLPAMEFFSEAMGTEPH